MKEINSNILSDITVHMKYAKYIPELQRRETWEELVDRNMAMHIKKPYVTLYKPQNQKECDQVIELITKNK